MPTVNLTTSNNQITGQNLTASGSGTSWTITSASGSSNAVTVNVSSGPVTISHTSRTPGQSVTISPTSSTGNYSVAFSQTVTSGGKGNQTTTVYTALVQGTVSGAASPSYSLGTVNNMNEGVSQTVTVTTSNVSNGTTLYFSIDGNPSSDFSATSGSFTISGNSGSFTLTTIADQTTENTEVFALRVRTGSTSGATVASTTFAVINTSSTPAATHSLGTVSNMNEGANQSISVTSTNFGSGFLYWSIDGSGDFTAHSGTISISNNSGSFTISSIGDQATEGNESKTLRLRTGSSSGAQVDSATFTLLDTSTGSGGSGGSGSGAGGSTTGTAVYGLAVYGPNGSSLVFGTNLRTQNALFSTTLSAVSGTTYGPFSVANANDTSKVQITSDYQATGNNAVSGSQMIITKSSTGFTFRHTSGGTKTFVLTAIQIG